MMEKQRTDQTYITSLQMYNVFPSFPTSFIVGADTVLEVSTTPRLWTSKV
jgi:hypothetical protein